VKLVELSDLFDVRYGHSLELNRLSIRAAAAGGIPFVSRKMGDNGIAAYVRRIDDVEPAPAGELTCALSGNGVLSTFIQDSEFYTAFHVARLSPNCTMSVNQKLYYCTCIKANRYRFSYGRQANRTLKELLIPEVESLPEWVEELNPEMFGGAERPVSKTIVSDPARDQWKRFRLSDLFELRKGKRLTKANLLNRPGTIPFIGAIDSNNGVSGSVDAAIHQGGTITVNYNGAGVADAFYQATDFWASDDVNVLYPKFEISPAVALFIATVIRREKYRFSYGRKWHLERMRESEIFLPANRQGLPDFDFMKSYIESMSFSSVIV